MIIRFARADPRYGNGNEMGWDGMGWESLASLLLAVLRFNGFFYLLFPELICCLCLMRASECTRGCTLLYLYFTLLYFTCVKKRNEKKRKANKRKVKR